MSVTKKLSSKTMDLSYQFYRGAYRRLLNILIAMLLISNVAIWVIIYVRLTMPAPEFFSAAEDGQILALRPIDENNMSQKEISEWTEEMVTKAYLLKVNNMQTDMMQLKQYFKPVGWKSYMSSTSELMQAVSNQSIQLIIEGISKPVVTKTGVYNGRRYWIVKTSVLLNMMNGSEANKQILNVELVIERVSLANNPKGVAVVDFKSRKQG